MNVKEYISSGVIEAYLMGDLSAEEEVKLFDLAAKEPELRKALDEAEETLFLMGQADSIKPPNKIKENLLHTIKPGNTNEAFEAVPSERSQKNASRSVVSIAASIVAIISIAATFYYRGEYLNSQQKLANMIAQNQQIAEEYQQAKYKAGMYEESLAILNQEGLERVQMKGLELAPNATAYVYWNQQTKSTYLNVVDMPENTTDKQYQLWALIDGKPVDMGVFDVRENMKKIIEMNQVESADAFAVTLEPRGGSENPTLDQMYVMGNFSS